VITKDHVITAAQTFDKLEAVIAAQYPSPNRRLQDIARFAPAYPIGMAPQKVDAVAERANPE